VPPLSSGEGESANLLHESGLRDDDGGAHGGAGAPKGRATHEFVGPLAEW